jgi:hypothetical protein
VLNIARIFENMDFASVEHFSFVLDVALLVSCATVSLNTGARFHCKCFGIEPLLNHGGVTDCVLRKLNDDLHDDLVVNISV